MDRAELIALASPPCHECGEPIQRIETGQWVENTDGDWVPSDYYMICANGHRVKVEHL